MVNTTTVGPSGPTLVIRLIPLSVTESSLLITVPAWLSADLPDTELPTDSVVMLEECSSLYLDEYVGSTSDSTIISTPVATAIPAFTRTRLINPFRMLSDTTFFCVSFVVPFFPKLSGVTASLKASFFFLSPTTLITTNAGTVKTIATSATLEFDHHISMIKSPAATEPTTPRIFFPSMEIAIHTGVISAQNPPKNPGLWNVRLICPMKFSFLILRAIVLFSSDDIRSCTNVNSSIGLTNISMMPNIPVITLTAITPYLNISVSASFLSPSFCGFI